MTAGLNAAAAAAVINSPSKVTTWQGKMIGEGFVVGMGMEEDAVKKQGETLALLAAGGSAAMNSASLGSLSGSASAALGNSYTTTNNNSTANEYVNITLNVEARDLQDVRTIEDIVAMAKRARAQYA